MSSTLPPLWPGSRSITTPSTGRVHLLWPDNSNRLSSSESRDHAKAAPGVTAPTGLALEAAAVCVAVPAGAGIAVAGVPAAGRASTSARLVAGNQDSVRRGANGRRSDVVTDLLIIFAFSAGTFPGLLSLPLLIASTGYLQRTSRFLRGVVGPHPVCDAGDVALLNLPCSNVVIVLTIRRLVVRHVIPPWWQSRFWHDSTAGG